MRNYLKAIRLVIKQYPLLLVIYLYKLVSNVITSLLPVYIVNYIVDKYPNYNYIYVIIMFVVIFLLVVISNLVAIYEDYISINIIPKISIMLCEKLKEIDYDFHESPEFLNNLSRSLEISSFVIYDAVNEFFSLIIYLVSAISILSVIYVMSPYAIAFAISIGIIYFFIRFFMSIINDKYLKKSQPLNRKIHYSNRAFTLKDSIADIKMTDISSVLLENHVKAYDKRIKLIKKYISKRTLLAVIGEVLMSLMYPGLVLIICYFMIDNLDVALFSSLTVAATTLSVTINNISSSLGQLQDISVEIKVPFELLQMKGNIESANLPDFNEEFQSLDISNVTFAYHKNKNVLKDISMHIEKGDHIAIVGSNGSGKTTLVKLLLHLYDPSNGTILINDKDYKRINAFSLRKVIGAVFQNIEMYSMTIAENVLLHKINSEEDKNIVDEALKFSGLYDYVYSLDDNINTIVTREFNSNGVIFSGGQIQKLAIARGYAQNYQVFILDEPSSALDPLAEAELYNKMISLGKDRTLIFISHRLTATVNASHIYLFEHGQIIEDGTHQSLMIKNGQYKHMFTSQAHKYLGEDYEK